MGGKTALAGRCGGFGNDGRDDCESNELVMDCILCRGEADVAKSSGPLWGAPGLDVLESDRGKRAGGAGEELCMLYEEAAGVDEDFEFTEEERLDSVLGRTREKALP